MNPIDLITGLVIGLVIGLLAGHLLATRRMQTRLTQLQRERDQAQSALDQAQALHQTALDALQREKALEVATLQRRLDDLQEAHRKELAAQAQAHHAALEAKDQAYAQLKETIQKEREQLRDAFSALSREALRHNNESFLKLAEQQLKRLQQQTANELEKKEKSVESLVRPILDTLGKTEEQLRKMEAERQKQAGELQQYLKQISETERNLIDETRRLVQALRRPEVRGQWGELTLRRLVELAGLVDHVDFSEQSTTTDEDDRRLRPDMLVHLPNDRLIVVDAKTPLDAYLNALEARDDKERQEYLDHHARKVRERVKELASKRYWNHFDGSIDFVVLFIPGEQFLTAALERDPGLLEWGLEKRVVLATPATLVALLRAVAFGWRQETLAENAQRIREEGERLYERLATFADHLEKVGKGLNQSIGAYNKAVGSFNRRLLPSAERFTELGLQPGKKSVTRLDDLTEHPRELALERPLPAESDAPA